MLHEPVTKLEKCTVFMEQDLSLKLLELTGILSDFGHLSFDFMAPEGLERDVRINPLAPSPKVETFWWKGTIIKIDPIPHE